MTTILVIVLTLLFSATVSADPAIVLKNPGLCGMIGADADGNMIYFPDAGFGIATTVMENDNKVMLKCLGTDVVNLSGKAQSFSGFGCGIMFPSGTGDGWTYDTHATVSASGVGTVTCTYYK
jgi:hypothetical protein